MLLVFATTFNNALTTNSSPEGMIYSVSHLKMSANVISHNINIAQDQNMYANKAHFCTLL